VKCPHCRTAFDLANAGPKTHDLGQDGEHLWKLSWVKCPACERFVVNLLSGPLEVVTAGKHRWVQLNTHRAESLQVHPLGATRPLSPEVPSAYAERFQRAVKVLPLAPDASAAVSRRLLQDLIHGEAGIKRRDLSSEIQELLDSNTLPSALADELDVIRTVGNFAAHPIKSQSTGEVVDVEPGEAESLLDVLEELFDFYFVRPAASRRRRDKLNEKLTDAGKPPLKAVGS